MKTGRPKLKEEKVKVNLSLSQECAEAIDAFAEKSGKTKGRIVEDAMKELSKIKGFENG